MAAFPPVMVRSPPETGRLLASGHGLYLRKLGYRSLPRGFPVTFEGIGSNTCGSGTPTFPVSFCPISQDARTPRFATSQHLKTVYEHGVLRPSEPLRLQEHQKVTLALETTENGGGAAEEKPIWEVAVDLVRDIPEEALESAPTDGAAQHDYYFYAAPKRD